MLVGLLIAKLTVDTISTGAEPLKLTVPVTPPLKEIALAVVSASAVATVVGANSTTAPLEFLVYSFLSVTFTASSP